MLRIGIGIRKDIRRVLFKIQESSDYEKFLEILKVVKTKHSYEVTERERQIFRAKKDRIMIRVSEQTRASLLRCISPHESKRKKGLYRIRAVKGYEKYARVLLHNVFQILPDLYSFVEIELNNAISYFRIHMRI